MAGTCDFGDQKESLMRDRIVLGTKNYRSRDARTELNMAIEMCKADEISQVHTRQVQGERESVGQGIASINTS